MKSSYFVTTVQGVALQRCDTEIEAREYAERHPLAFIPAGVRVTDMWGHTLAVIGK